MVVGCHVLRSVHFLLLLLLPASGPLVTRALFSKNKRYERGNEFTKSSRHRSAMHGSMVVGRREEGGWLERFSNKTKD